jgi:hypothetical protein
MPLQAARRFVGLTIFELTPCAFSSINACGDVSKFAGDCWIATTIVLSGNSALTIARISAFVMGFFCWAIAGRAATTTQITNIVATNIL